MEKLKFYILLLIVSGCYSLDTTEDIDKYVSYIDNRTDTTIKSKSFDTPNSDRKSFGKTEISELRTNRSDIVRISVNIDLKELKAKYKFYYNLDVLVYCEITESKNNGDWTLGNFSTDEIHYFKEGKSLKSYSKINQESNQQRALILSKFYYLDNF
ncbi:hypothetical protein [Winogradskyella sp.]|uniref:hypothetical protein n=1 Tax=Winogradskyella sp. TaxID=1883156 RepID=UPI002629F698|nr:hypothetical protein [Winogradskyella sp.]